MIEYALGSLWTIGVVALSAAIALRLIAGKRPSKQTKIMNRLAKIGSICLAISILTTGYIEAWPRSTTSWEFTLIMLRSSLGWLIVAVFISAEVGILCWYFVRSIKMLILACREEWVKFKKTCKESFTRNNASS